MNPFRRPVVHTVVQHEVAASGALAALIRGLSASINAVALEIGDGLHAIALALSTKDDNSARILELVNRVKAVREKLKSSVDNQTEGE